MASPPTVDTTKLCFAATPLLFLIVLVSYVMGLKIESKIAIGMVRGFLQLSFSAL